MKLFISPIGLTIALTIAGLSQCNGQQYPGNYNYDGYRQPPSYNQGYGNNYQGYGNNYQEYGRNRYTNGQIVDKTYFANHNNGNNQVYGNNNQGYGNQDNNLQNQSNVHSDHIMLDNLLSKLDNYKAGVLLKDGEPTSCEVALIDSTLGVASAACFKFSKMLNGMTMNYNAQQGYEVLVSQGNTKTVGLYNVTQVIPHPNYNQETFANNIAVIKFENKQEDWKDVFLAFKRPNETTPTFMVRREIDSAEDETWHPPLMQRYQAGQMNQNCASLNPLYGLNPEYFYCGLVEATVTYKPACPLPYGSLYGENMDLVALYSHSAVVNGTGLCDTNSRAYNYYVVISKYYNWIVNMMYMLKPPKGGKPKQLNTVAMREPQRYKSTVKREEPDKARLGNDIFAVSSGNSPDNPLNFSGAKQVSAVSMGGDLYTIPGNKNVILNPSQIQGEPANTEVPSSAGWYPGYPTTRPVDPGYVVPDPILIIGQDQPPTTTPQPTPVIQQPTPVIQQPGSVDTSTVLVPTTVVSVVTVGQQPLQQPVAGSTGGNTINNNITVAAPTGQDKTVTVTPPQPSTVTVSQSPQQQPPASTVLIQPTAAQPTNTVSVIQQPPPPASTVSVIQQPPPPATTVIQQQPPSQGTVTVSAPATVTASTPPQQSTVTVTPPKTVTASTPSTVTVTPPSTVTASTPSTVTVTPPKTVTASTPSTVTVSDPGTVTISPSPVEVNSTLVVSPSPVLPGANGTHAQDNTTVTVTSTTTIMPVPTTTDEHPMFVISSGLPRPSATASDYVPINGLPTFNSTVSESPTQADNARKHIKTWTIIGIVAGILAFLALCYLMYRQYKKRNGGVDPYSRVRNWWFSGRHQQERPQSMISTISSPAPSYRTNSYRHSNVYRH